MYRFILLFILITYSCSSSYYLKKAIKKEPSIINERVHIDTVKIIRLDSVPYIHNDTIRFRVFERVTDTLIEFRYKYIEKPNTKQVERLEYNIKKLKEKNKFRKEKVIIRNEKKKDKIKKRNSMSWSKIFWIIILIISFFIIRSISGLLKNK